MRKFKYFEPKSLAEAISLLEHYGHGARILAGGTNLVPELKAGAIKPVCVVNIKTVDGLRVAYEDSEGIHIGALVTQAELAWVEISRRRIVPPSLLKRIPMPLRKIMSLMGNPQVRNIATIAGNLAWASPAADLAPPLLTLDAQVKVYGSVGERTLSLDTFFRGPGKTVLKQNEIITEILIPSRSLDKVAMAHKFMKRKANTLSVCSAAVSLNRISGKTVKDVRIAVGAVAPIPMRMRRAESLLEGQAIHERLLGKIKEMVFEEINPITDGRSTAWFRKEVTPILVERCITEALA